MNNLKNRAAAFLLHSPLRPRSWDACLHTHWPILQHAMQENPHALTQALQCLAALDAGNVGRRTLGRLLKLRKFCRSSSSDADRALYCFLCALYRERRGEREEMITDLRAACHWGHTYHTIHAMLGTHCLMESGLYRLASEAYDQAIGCLYRYPPLDDGKRRLIAVMQAHQATALLMMHRTAEAETLLNRSEPAAGSPGYLYALAMLQASRGLAEEARQTLETLRKQRTPLTSYVQTHVSLLLNGTHPHFTVLPADPNKLRRFWDVFQSREGAILASLKEGKGSSACFHQICIAFRSLWPTDETADRMSLHFRLQDGRPQLHLSALYSRTYDALIEQLIALCPPGITDRWDIIRRFDDPEPEGTSFWGTVLPRKLPLRRKLQNAIARIALNPPFAHKAWQQYYQEFFPIISPAFHDDPCGRLLTLRTLDDLKSGKPNRALRKLLRLQNITRDGPDPDRILFSFLRGLHSDALGNITDTMRFFRWAADCGASHPLIHVRLGAYYLFDKHLYDNAHDHFTQMLHCISLYSIEEDSKAIAIGEARACLACVLFMMHRTQEAESMLSAAYAALNTAMYQYAAILQYALRGQEDDAMVHLRELQCINPGLSQNIEPGICMLLNGTHPHFTAHQPNFPAIHAYWHWFVSNEPQLREAIVSRDDNTFRRLENPHFDLLCPEPSNIDVMFRRVRMLQGRPTITFDDNYSQNYAALIDALIAACPPEVTEHWTIDRVIRSPQPAPSITPPTPLKTNAKEAPSCTKNCNESLTTPAASYSSEAQV